MPPTLNAAETCPFVSLLLLRVTSKSKQAKSEGRLLDGVKELLDIQTSGNHPRIEKGQDSGTKAGVEFACVHYVEASQPTWLLTTSQGTVDSVNQLIVVCRFKSYLGLYSSDQGARNGIFKEIRDRTQGIQSLAEFDIVPRELLDTAFMGGPTRTLWLSGVHRRTSVKPDSKMLIGIDLENALNPLEDQSYHYTAARTMAPIAGETRSVGLAHAKSSLWLSATANWMEFCKISKAILEQLSLTSGKPVEVYPMRFLAEPIDGVSSLTSAFDVSFVPPELLVMGADAGQVKNQRLAEKWAYESEFTAVSQTADKITSKVFLRGQELGDIQLVVASTGQKVSVKVSGSMKAGASQADWKELIQASKNVRWLKIRFDDGMTLSDGKIFKMRFRDYLFSGWRFEPFGEGVPTGNGKRIDVMKEKPTVTGSTAFSVKDIGKQRSLFCWVANNWRTHKEFGCGKGFLFCDDGGDEIADFIQLEIAPQDGGDPILTLIHVKAANSDAADRQISVSDYEVVCGQAVKNLHALDSDTLRKLVLRNVGNAVEWATWENGNHLGDRKKLIQAINNLGSNYRRRVVILQPRVTKTRHDAVAKTFRNPNGAREADRFRQLNTLLLEAELACKGMGADFYVIGSDL